MGLLCSIINGVPVLNDVELLDDACPDGAGQTPLGNLAIIVFFIVGLFTR